jgi:uncharacterized membrane protein
MATALKSGKRIARGWATFWLVVGTLACAGTAPLAAVGAIFSWLVFDRPGNALNPLAWLCFLLMSFFWAVCIAAPFAAWVFWTRKQETHAWAAISTPLIWGILMAALFQFVAG